MPSACTTTVALARACALVAHRRVSAPFSGSLVPLDCAAVLSLWAPFSLYVLCSLTHRLNVSQRAHLVQQICLPE